MTLSYFISECRTMFDNDSYMRDVMTSTDNKSIRIFIAGMLKEKEERKERQDMFYRRARRTILGNLQQNCA